MPYSHVNILSQTGVKHRGDGEPLLRLNSIEFPLLPHYKSKPSDLKSRYILFQEIQDLVDRLALHDMYRFHFTTSLYLVRADYKLFVRAKVEHVHQAERKVHLYKLSSP